MADGVPENVVLAIGKLTGNVEGLVRMLEQQNLNSAKVRDEYLEVFKGIRTDSQKQSDLLQAHIKEDNANTQILLDVSTWKKDTEPKVDTLWDAQNKQKGWLLAVGTIGSIVGGAIVAGIEYIRK